MNSLPPNPPPNKDTWTASDDLPGFCLALAVIALLLMLIGCPATDERPPFPCDVSCTPRKCQPWCGTPPAFPVREAPTPTSPAIIVYGF